MQARCSLFGFKFHTLGALILLVAGTLQNYTQSQSKYGSYTFALVSRQDGGSVNIRVDENASHCWITSSKDHSVAISIGDNLCAAWEGTVGDEAALAGRIMPNKISFRLGGKRYSVTDLSTVEAIRSLFDPLLNVEARQSYLVEQLSNLAQKESEFSQQAQAKVMVPDLSQELQKIESDARRVSAQSGTEAQLKELQTELSDLQQRLGDLQSRGNNAQSNLSDQQSILADQQVRLGDQQFALRDQGQALALRIAENVRLRLLELVHSGVAKGE